MTAPSTKVTATTTAGALAYIVAEIAQRAGLLSGTLDPVLLEALQIIIAGLLALAAGYLVPETRPSDSAVELITRRNGWRNALGDPQYVTPRDAADELTGPSVAQSDFGTYTVQQFYDDGEYVPAELVGDGNPQPGTEVHVTNLVPGARLNLRLDPPEPTTDES